MEPDGGGFEILLGVAGADGVLDGHHTDAERLLDRPSRAQAYLITAQESNRLLLSALDGRGSITPP